MNLKDHCIYTERDGILDKDETTAPDVDRLVDKLRDQGKIVIHLHGGLVEKEEAKAKAKELIPEYLSAGAYPVFFIYQSGLLETIGHNLHEIAYEKIFEKLVKKLMKYVVGKLTALAGIKGPESLNLPYDLDVDIEFRKTYDNKEPFPDIKVAEEIYELEETEKSMFMDELADDLDFQEEIQAIVDGATPDQEKKDIGAKGALAKHRISSRTLMSKDIIEELVKDAGLKQAKGIFLSAGFIIRAGKILARVVMRFVKKRDHGVYATIVEEVLRELYIANIGAAIYEMMKKETRDTFDPPAQGEIRGGRYFVEQLGKILKETGHKPDISIVAHSLGSVFACNLIHHMALARENDTHNLPRDFKLKNLIFLGPAVEFSVFAATLNKHKDLFEHFRMFALKDEIESGYWEVKLIYPRSLLYMVSGVFEKQDDGESAFDHPLVGMERYYTKTHVYDQPEVKSVRDYIKSQSDRVVWAVDDRGNGLASDAIRHTGFDDAIFEQGQEPLRKTIDSIKYILQEDM